MAHVLLLGNAEGTGPFTVQDAAKFRARPTGIVADDTTDASAAITDALKALDRSLGGVVDIPPGKYYVRSPIEIPHDFADGAHVLIRGYGAHLRTDQPISIFSRRPTNQTEALDKMVGLGVTIEGLTGRGTGHPDQRFIDLGATFGSRIVSCNAWSVGVGFNLEFCLNARLESCRATQCVTHGFVVRTGTWTGSDGYNSQSNNAMLANCRNYAAAGSETGFYILGTHGVILDSCIAEGGNPVRNVLFDYNGSGACRHFTVRNLHVENLPTGSHIFISAAGTVDLDGLWYQAGDVLVEWGLGTQWTVVRNVPWIASARPFKCTPSGWGSVTLENVGMGIDCTQASRWVGDVLPDLITKR